MSAILKTINLNGSNGSHFFLRLYCESITQTRNPKKSVLRLVPSVGSRDAYSGSGSACSCYINGVYAGSFTGIASYGETFIPGLDVAFTHDANGECLANYSVTVNINWSGLATTTLTGTLELPKIWDNITGVSKRISSYYKGTSWGLKRFYYKENGVWKPAKVLYKKEGVWI